MPSIPITSPLSYIGVFFLIFGFFLVLAGIGIFKIEKVTVQPGKKTLAVGITLAILGLIFLLFDTFSPLLDMGISTPFAPSGLSHVTVTPFSPLDTLFIATSPVALDCGGVGGIGGKVVDSQDNAPLAGAHISTFPGSGAAISDSQGFYLICNVAPGTYIIKAEKSGYQYNSFYIEVTENLTTIADIALEK